MGKAYEVSQDSRHDHNVVTIPFDFLIEVAT